LCGTALGLKKHNPGILTVAVEPSNSAVLSGGSPGSHKIQGIGAGFVPKNFNSDVVDLITTVEDEDAYKATNLVVRTEGIFVGISSGAALHVAIELAKKEENHGKNIVVVFPDTGERYLSENVF
jgi:cysteine synthase A